MERVCTIEEMASAPPYNEMIPGLYMGSRRAVEGQPKIFDLYVGCAVELKPPRSIMGKFKTMWVPLSDTEWEFRDRPEEINMLVGAARQIAAQVMAGKKVLIYCNMGMNRSGLMMALTLMQLGYSLNEALSLIRARNRCTLSNDSFMAALEHIERGMGRRMAANRGRRR
jgi:protein-tyrosine phosphatase